MTILHNDYNAMLLGFRTPNDEELKSVDIFEELCGLLKVPQNKKQELSDYFNPLIEKILENKKDMSSKDPSDIKYVRNMLVSLSMKVSSLYYKFNRVNQFTISHNKKTLQNNLYDILNVEMDN
jgi:hypothetical protein